MRRQATIRIRAGGMNRLREIAAQFGAVSSSGVRAGEPSVSELLDKIVSGELVIMEREMDKQQVSEPAVVLGPTGLETGPGWDALMAEGEANLERAKQGA